VNLHPGEGDFRGNRRAKRSSSGRLGTAGELLADQVVGTAFVVAIGLSRQEPAAIASCVTAHSSRSACTNACGRLPRIWR
jgi:hypothetical protein